MQRGKKFHWGTYTRWSDVLYVAPLPQKKNNTICSLQAAYVFNTWLKNIIMHHSAKKNNNTVFHERPTHIHIHIKK
jgi:hypothetical protein